MFVLSFTSKLLIGCCFTVRKSKNCRTQILKWLSYCLFDDRRVNQISTFNVTIAINIRRWHCEYGIWLTRYFRIFYRCDENIIFQFKALNKNYHIVFTITKMNMSSPFTFQLFCRFIFTSAMMMTLNWMAPCVAKLQMYWKNRRPSPVVLKNYFKIYVELL